MFLIVIFDMSILLVRVLGNAVAVPHSTSRAGGVAPDGPRNSRGGGALRDRSDDSQTLAGRPDKPRHANVLAWLSGYLK